MGSVPAPVHPFVDSKGKFIRGLFDRLAPRYDRFNRIASFGLDRRWRRETALRLELLPGMRVLDLASGTGDLAHDCAERLIPLGEVIACDLSWPMLAIGRERLSRHPTARWHVRYAQGSAEALPFQEAGFDAAVMGFALRNVSDLNRTFRQFHRVLKPGGRLALLEFGRPRHPLVRLGHWVWLTLAIPPIGWLVTGRLGPFLYLRRSILRFMPPERVIEELRGAGFIEAQALALTGGTVFLYTARRPA